MLEIKDIDGATFAFPASVIEQGLLLPESEIPKDFPNRELWEELFAKIFYSGGVKGKDLYLVQKKGVDGKKAFRQITAVMKSYQPRHQHKEIGVSFMFSEWFESYGWKDQESEKKASKVFFQEELPDGDA